MIDMTTSESENDYMRVGVRELKANLSAYLDRAASGATIIVTDRGRPKVEIRALGVERRIAEGMRAGWISPAAKPGRPPLPASRFKGRITISEAMAEDHGT